MTRSGRLYALPTLALPTAGIGGSASLNVPTPTASDAVWGDKKYERRGKDGRNHNLGLVEWAKMLPTPRTPSGGPDRPGARASRGGGSDDLPTTVTSLLPTPDATHGRKATRTSELLPGAVEALLPTPDAYEGSRGSGGDPKVRRASGHSLNLGDVIERGLPGEPTPERSSDGSE
jgi:hypothetical protein